MIAGYKTRAVRLMTLNWTFTAHVQRTSCRAHEFDKISADCAHLAVALIRCKIYTRLCDTFFDRNILVDSADILVCHGDVLEVVPSKIW